jgi:nucleoside-diphosphate-sugar epimerase
MRVFLTGATGQVGRAIAARLDSEGYVVIGMSRKRRDVQGLSEHFEANLGSEETVDLIKRAVLPCEMIVHAAASLSHDLYDPTISLTNCLGTQLILRLAELWRTRQMVYLSSVPVIGLPQSDPITEEHPVNPPSAYHASKLYGEYLMQIANRDGFRAVSLRLSSPAGPGTPANRILATFVRRARANEPLKILGRGSRKQNYVDVRDIAAAVNASLNMNASGLYNVAAAQSVSNHELALTCVDELSSSSPIEFSGKPDPEEGVMWNVSIAKAQRDLAFYPRFSIRDSIQAISDEFTTSG